MKYEGRTKFVYVTYIKTTPETLWSALVEPEMTKRYWSHANVSDWKVGSKWEHRRLDATNQADVVGVVIESDPPHRLVTTWASPDEADNPDKISRVTFEIELFERGTVRLTVTHDELEQGSNTVMGVSEGWPQVLSSLKSLLETNAALAMPWSSDLSA